MMKEGKDAGMMHRHRHYHMEMRDHQMTPDGAILQLFRTSEERGKPQFSAACSTSSIPSPAASFPSKPMT